MQAVILAGGLASRLGELSKNRPKSMTPVHQRPFLEYQLEFLKKGGIEDIVLCVGHMKDQIMEQFGDGRGYGVSIKYSCEEQLLGTAGALKNAAGLLEGVFFTVYGDSYLFLDFPSIMAYFLGQNKLALMTVLRNQDRYDRSNTAIQDGLVTRYDRKDRSGLSYIDYGANIFRKEVLGLIPENQHYSMEELFPKLIEQGELLAFKVKQRFYEIGSPQGLKEFTEYMSVTR